MTTYIYITQDDKNRLSKLAQSKQLSLSACVDIIASKFYFLVANKEEYIKKGDIKVKLNIKNKATWPVSDKLATNCITAFFHEELNDFPNKDGIKNLKRQIQSQMDKTFDPNFLKNIIIRTNYRTNKGQTA